MRYRLVRLLSVIALAGFATVQVAVPAFAASAPVSDVRVLGSTVYVASGAYFTHTDPNVLLAKLG